MADHDPIEDADKLLAGMDFAAMAAELDERRRRELSSLLRALLEVVDSLERLEAHCHAKAERGAGNMPTKSVELIRRQLLRALSEAGAEPMEAVGSDLDLDRHEVASTRHDPAVEADRVLEELQRGYLWRGAILRRAKVAVSRREQDGESRSRDQEQR